MSHDLQIEPEMDPFSVAINGAIRAVGDVPRPNVGWCSWGSEAAHRPSAWRHESCLYLPAGGGQAPEQLSQSTFWLVTWRPDIRSQPATGCVVSLKEPVSLETTTFMTSVFNLGNAIEIRGDHVGEVTALYDRLVRAAEPLGKGHIPPDEVGDRCLVFDAAGGPVGVDGPHVAAYDLYSWPNGRTACLLDEERPPGVRICLGHDGVLSTEARRAGSRILSLGLPVGIYGHSRGAVDGTWAALLATHRPAFGQ